MPVGEEIPLSEIADSREVRTHLAGDQGSIIIIVATDAPLLPHQCRRLAQRATIGLARTGGYGSKGSGDIFLAFSTGNRGVDRAENLAPTMVRCFPNNTISGLFEATMEATEEAIVNAMCMATTMFGINGRVCEAIPLDRLSATMHKYGRLHRA